MRTVVLVELYDGRKQVVEGFKDDIEAQDWIDQERPKQPLSIFTIIPTMAPYTLTT